MVHLEGFFHPSGREANRRVAFIDFTAAGIISVLPLEIVLRRPKPDRLDRGKPHVSFDPCGISGGVHLGVI